MRPVTVDLLHSLEMYPWFEFVGQPVPLAGAAFVKSWTDAISNCTSDRWNEFRLEAKNRLTLQISQRSRERWNHWNRTSDELQPPVVDIVGRKSQSIISENSLPEAFRNSVVWDIALAAAECEFNDLVDSGLPTILLGVYKLGHFPCGLSPNAGELLIF